MFNRDFWALSPFEENAFGSGVNVAEDAQQIRVTVNLPGIDEKDANVAITNGDLVVRSEKTTEQSYESFQRVIRLPQGVETTKADAKLTKGVLTVTVPKKPEPERDIKKIPVRRG
jgi:HSP20 family protein